MSISRENPTRDALQFVNKPYLGFIIDNFRRGSIIRDLPITIKEVSSVFKNDSGFFVELLKEDMKSITDEFELAPNFGKDTTVFNIRIKSDILNDSKKNIKYNLIVIFFIFNTIQFGFCL